VKEWKEGKTSLKEGYSMAPKRIVWWVRVVLLIGLLFNLGILSTYAQESQDKEKIKEVLEKYRTGWLKLDTNILKSIWDQEYKNIVYVAVELKKPIYGWAGVKDYYERTAKELLQVKDFTLQNISLDIFHDIAFAFATYHFEAISKTGKEPIGGDGRISFILRKKGNQWLLIHYHESAAPTPPHAMPSENK
jgi:ketosteroid isomerase-like protein